MRNIANAIVIVGMLTLAVFCLWKSIHSLYIWITLAIGFGTGFLTWTKLDNKINNKLKDLDVKRQQLKNEKLQIEIDLLKKEMKK